VRAQPATNLTSASDPTLGLPTEEQRVRRDDWNARYAGTDMVWGVEPNRFVAAECAGLVPGRAADLACGEGRNAVWLAERGWQVTAVDFAAAGVEKGRRLAAARGVEDRITWGVADLTEWEAQPGAFDLVVVAYLQVPASDRAVIWPRAAAALAPGGTLVVVGHDARNLRDGTGGPQDPAVLYTADDVVAHLGDLTVVRAGEVERPVGDAVAIDCLVVARRAAPAAGA
jgi:SAM-dependent methyltransferase